MHMIDLIPFEVSSSKYILSALSQEERYQENCCPEVLFSPGPAEGSHTSLPSADFAKLNLHCGTICWCPRFTFHFSVHGCGAGARRCVLWRDASAQGETGIGSWNLVGNVCTIRSLLLILLQVRKMGQVWGLFLFDSCWWQVYSCSFSFFQFELDTSKVKAK